MPEKENRTDSDLMKPVGVGAVGSLDKPVYRNNDFKFKEPRWDIWRKKPTCSINEACFLLMNIEPIEYEEEEIIKKMVSSGVKMSEKEMHVLTKYKEVQDVIAVAFANMQERGGNLKIFNIEYYDYGVTWVTVRIADFGEWARSCGFSLPDGFPVNDVASTKNTEANGFSSERESKKVHRLIVEMLRVFKEIKPNFTQEWLAGEIGKKDIYGLKKTNVCEIFSKAKKMLD